MKKVITAVGVLGLAVGAGYWLAPREQIDSEVRQSGLLQTDRRRVLSATVESLRGMNKLAVFSYKGTVRAEAERTKFFVFGGDQVLIVAGTATFFIDLSRLACDVDREGKVVTIKLPPLELGDIAFEPEQAVTLNGGILTFISQSQVDDLLKQNWASARRAMTKQAQGEGFTTAARRQARDNIRTIVQRASPGVLVTFE